MLIENSATGLMLTTLSLTDAGFRALNLDPPNGDETAATDATESPQGAVDANPAMLTPPADAAADGATSAPTVAARATLRGAGVAVLAAWGDEANRTAECLAALEAPMAALRLVLAGRVSRTPRSGRLICPVPMT